MTNVNKIYIDIFTLKKAYGRTLRGRQSPLKKFSAGELRCSDAHRKIIAQRYCESQLKKEKKIEKQYFSNK